jgi:hypothetical protein
MIADLATLNSVVPKINLVAVIDSSGRGGNLFFLTLFDAHPEVVSCPIVQYSYSYALAEFGDDTVINAHQAHEFLSRKSYFRLLYKDLDDEDSLLFERMGGDPKCSFDRAQLRKIIDDYFFSRSEITRRELIVAPLVAYALVRGIDSRSLKYVLIGDAISKRTENVVKGFSGDIIDRILMDYPDAKIFRLVRDPRATFASPRHQFVNSLGNMYAIMPNNYFSRLITLVSGVLTPENGCVYLYWLLYLRQAENSILKKEAQYPKSFRVVKNESLNLNFVKSMQLIGEWLDINIIEPWKNENFVPTVIGVPWAGAGAYNSRYQRATSGLLKNDPIEISQNVTGPNEYVTRRWRTRLNLQEIYLIECLFFRDLNAYGYEFLTAAKEKPPLLTLLLRIIGPFEGELPAWWWIKKGFSEGFREGANRLFYSAFFPPFYIASRIKLIQYYLRGLL